MSDSSANEGRTMHELEQEYKEALEQVAMKKLEQEFFEEMEQNQGHIDLLEKNNFYENTIQMAKNKINKEIYLKSEQEREENEMEINDYIQELIENNPRRDPGAAAERDFFLKRFSDRSAPMTDYQLKKAKEQFEKRKEEFKYKKSGLYDEDYGLKHKELYMSLAQKESERTEAVYKIYEDLAEIQKISHLIKEGLDLESPKFYFNELLSEEEQAQVASDLEERLRMAEGQYDDMGEDPEVEKEIARVNNEINLRLGMIKQKALSNYKKIQSTNRASVF